MLYLASITPREYLHMGPNLFEEIRRRGCREGDGVAIIVVATVF